MTHHENGLVSSFGRCLLLEVSLYVTIGFLERFSTERRQTKTKTKVITLANHNRRRQSNESIRTRNKYIQPARNAGKRVQTRNDWFWYYFWLVEKVAPITIQNQSNHEITFDTQLKTGSYFKLIMYVICHFLQCREYENTFLWMV